VWSWEQLARSGGLVVKVTWKDEIKDVYGPEKGC